PAETPSRPANSAPADSKPSPMPPPEVAKQEPSATPPVEKQPELKPPVEEPVTKSTAKEETAPVRNPLAQPPSQRPPVRTVATPKAVAIISSPGGATATLDGRPDAVCTTPCSLDASPGRHTIAITMPGYQVEHREVEVGTAPIEIPAVILRAPGGTLMLTS